MSRVSRYVRRGYLHRRYMGRHVSMSPRDPGPPGTIYWAGQQSAGVRVVISLHTDDLHTAVRRAAVLVDAIEREGAHARTWTDHDAFLKALESAGKWAGRILLRKRRDTL